MLAPQLQDKVKDLAKELDIPEEKIFYRTPDGSVIIINDDFQGQLYKA
jgi:hypothetical protein